MLSAYDFQLDVYRAMCAAAWIMFFLILKNVVLVLALVVRRRKESLYKIPEDADKFGPSRPTEYIDEYSLTGRIEKCLKNDVEYVPYFFILLLIMFCRVDLVRKENHHYLARTCLYGLTFVVARYLHTIAYLIRNSYGRILGFLLSVLIIFVLFIDHLYYMSKSVYPSP